MDSLSFWSLVIDGGYIMIPLAILLLLTIYIFTERCIAIQRALNDDPTFMKRIRDYVHEADLESAVRLCKNTDTPYSRMILKGLQRIGRPTQDVMTAIENSGNLEIANLGKGLPWLSTTAAGAPMLGFLGTVVGMIQAFYTLAKAGAASNITLLSGGIYQALVTTVAGLVVGIIALFAYNYLVARINRVMNRMEARSIEFMDLLNEPA
ncbi:MAG: MotA/TolQ/ExbB proton channel family protein [Bacteroides sp.]|nr:MotA/TolQ/ExbB proton channel family protein [Bacteroides sp.]MDE6236185.1 MotA/TolQ/ExbB proton channel family protein [Muribaculaceae bacterium]